MQKMLKREKGFTLIELMIVVAIIGIMAAIAIPNFLNYMCKTRQTEAKMGLAAIRTDEESYWVEFSRYTTNKTAIGFSVKAGGVYSFRLNASEPTTSFTATASGMPKNHTDVWTLTGNAEFSNQIFNDTPGCVL